jgi:hypothetical protein
MKEKVLKIAQEFFECDIAKIDLFFESSAHTF